MKQRLLAIPAVLIVAAGLLITPLTTAAAPAVGFSKPVYIDTQLAGGEPEVVYSPKYKTFVYTSHQGTTHLYRPGVAAPDSSSFVCSTANTSCYDNHVNIWVSADDAKSWKFVDESPMYTGFSDPDLAIDDQGTIYNTGIDLANDALFSSPDGGKTWTKGTPYCTNGDRPWLAAGKPGTVFLANSNGNYTVLRSTDYGANCSSSGFGNAGASGKPYYDHKTGDLIAPLDLGSGNNVTLGVSLLRDVDAAFNSGTGAWQQIPAVKNTSQLAFFGGLTVDDATNVFIAWADSPRDPKSNGGCPSQLPGGTAANTPMANRVLLSMGERKARGRWNFSPPITLYTNTNGISYWPWAIAGDAGNVSVVWYQTDKVTDLDCDTLNGKTQNAKTFIYEAHIQNALDPASRTMSVTNVSGRAIHEGTVCQGGTGCVATGKDRRLGDYFTNNLDRNGCVLIASGDTMIKDQITGGELITSRPIFMRQTTGPSLTGRDCATGEVLSASSGGAQVQSPATTPAQAQLPDTLRQIGTGRALALVTLVAVIALLLALFVPGWRRSA